MVLTSIFVFAYSMDIMEKDQNCSDATKSWSSIEVLFCASSYLN